MTMLWNDENGSQKKYVKKSHKQCQKRKVNLEYFSMVLYHFTMKQAVTQSQSVNIATEEKSIQLLFFRSKSSIFDYEIWIYKVYIPKSQLSSEIVTLFLLNSLLFSTINCIKFRTSINWSESLLKINNNIDSTGEQWANTKWSTESELKSM